MTSVRRWREVLGRSLLLCGLLVSACEDTPPPSDMAAVVVDLSGPDLAHEEFAISSDPPRDMAGPAAEVGTVCGNGLCYNSENQYCATVDWGATGSCAMSPSPEPNLYACDGPEDCSTMACCFLINASVCGLYGFCVAGNVTGEFMCHVDADCGTSIASKCCPKGSTGSYRTCVDGLGPTDACPPVP